MLALCITLISGYIYYCLKFKVEESMSRLHDFITRIRNCKTMAEERAEYQKEMAVIRDSFSKNQENLRPRNVTKLLFINMSGQETNFGQMECLKLITGNTLIEKRIGYLGLTQLFHEKSELLMMATNRIRVDLAHSNNNLVGLALCVLSEICTTELATQLHKQVLKCISSSSRYVKKKAILTAIKLLKKAPEYLGDFLPKVIEALDDKNHGVLLGAFAFLQNALTIDDSIALRLADLVGKYSSIYKQVVGEYNSEYQMSGVQDPFLQVTILRYLRALRKYIDDNTFLRSFGQILVTAHDAISSKIGTSTKNGPNAVLFECFQCMMTIPPNANLSHYTESVLTKFVSVKDANSKYLSLFNLGLMAKHDIDVARRYKNSILECLQQNDLLIRVMALDLLYLISNAENVNEIIKELLNVLLSANDEEFISQLALKICLIVQKHSETRRWHFDTILKVLVLADRSCKEDSAKSLVHLITGTPELQPYCLAKLFFSASQNPQNDTLCEVTMYLLGQFGHLLTNIGYLKVTKEHIINLIETIIFKASVADETIEYGLTSLFKLYDKFRDEGERIAKIIKLFESHSNLEVQKRACEYSRLLEASWNGDREREVCIPVPTLKASAEAFAEIRIGDTKIDIDPSTVKFPEKIEINYDEQASKIAYVQQKQVKISYGHDHSKDIFQPPEQKNVVAQPDPNQFKKKKVASLLDDDDEDVSPPPPPPPKQRVDPPQDNSDPFDILGLDIGGSQPVKTQPPPSSGGDLLGGFSFDQPQQNKQYQSQSNPVSQSFGQGGDLLGGGDFFGNNQSNKSKPLQQNSVNQQSAGGFDLLGDSSPSFSNSSNHSNLQPPQQQYQQPPPQQQTHKFKALETGELELWMQARKESQQDTRIIASFMNKTPNYIDGIITQIAVLKYLKINIQPLNNNAMPANSKGAVKQIMTVTNTAVGQKGIVMKIKLSYTMNGQKFNQEFKVDGFPLGF